MSRSRHVKVGRNWRHRWRAMRTLETRAARQQTRACLHLEVREPAEPDELALEVRADAEEQAGRLHLAELLRRGRDLTALPR